MFVFLLVLTSETSITQRIGAGPDLLKNLAAPNFQLYFLLRFVVSPGLLLAHFIAKTLANKGSLFMFLSEMLWVLNRPKNINFSLTILLWSILVYRAAELPQH